VIGDFERPARRRVAQDRALARYLQNEVGPFSPRYGPLLREQPVAAVDGLAALPLSRIEQLSADDNAELVLQPTGERIAASGNRRLARRLQLAKWSRQVGVFNRRTVEPAYKPVHWLLAGDRLPMGYTATDVEQLADIGRHQLELAGIGPNDVLVGVLPPGPSVGFWQMSLGARRAGVPSLFLPSSPEPSRFRSR